MEDSAADLLLWAHDHERWLSNIYSMGGKPMEVVKHESEAYLVTETVTGALRTRLFILEEDIDLVDGDGELRTISAGAKLLVVEAPGGESALCEKLLDTSDRYLHGLWGHRPHNEATSTTFDIRTNKGGRRPDAEGVPF